MIHNKDLDTLYEHVPKEILPEEYGGTGESIQSCTGNNKIFITFTWVYDVLSFILIPITLYYSYHIILFLSHDEKRKRSLLSCGTFADELITNI